MSEQEGGCRWLAGRNMVEWRPKSGLYARTYLYTEDTTDMVYVRLHDPLHLRLAEGRELDVVDLAVASGANLEVVAEAVYLDLRS